VRGIISSRKKKPPPVANTIIYTEPDPCATIANPEYDSKHDPGPDPIVNTVKQ